LEGDNGMSVIGALSDGGPNTKQLTTSSLRRVVAIACISTVLLDGDLLLMLLPGSTSASDRVHGLLVGRHDPTLTTATDYSRIYYTWIVLILEV